MRTPPILGMSKCVGIEGSFLSLFFPLFWGRGRGRGVVSLTKVRRAIGDVYRCPSTLRNSILSSHETEFPVKKFHFLKS